MARPTLPASGGDLGFWNVALVAAINDISDRADGQLPKTTRSASYTLTAADIATTVYVTAATAVTITVPTGVGTAEQRCLIRARGAGQVTIAAGTGMTLNSVAETPPFVMAGQHAVVEIVWFSGTEAYVDGALA